jgi:hypothetical protein
VPNFKSRFQMIRDGTTVRGHRLHPSIPAGAAQKRGRIHREPNPEATGAKHYTQNCNLFLAPQSPPVTPSLRTKRDFPNRHESRSEESVHGSPASGTWASHRAWRNACLPTPPPPPLQHRNRASSNLLSSGWSTAYSSASAKPHSPGTHSAAGATTTTTSEPRPRRPPATPPPSPYAACRPVGAGSSMKNRGGETLGGGRNRRNGGGGRGIEWVGETGRQGGRGGVKRKKRKGRRKNNGALF